MLRLLRVRNFALIDELTIEFDRGLNVLSGETGAGKSLIVDALSLVAGGRASGETIRSGEHHAVVEAVIDNSGDSIDFDSLGLDRLPDGGELILRREILSDNRNRVFINNQPATASALRALASVLIDIHGQHEQQSLLNTATQLSLIDRAGQTETLRSRVGDLYDELHNLHEELESLAALEASMLQRQDLLTFQKAEIEQVAPEAGEADRLRNQVRVLAHAEKLLNAAGSAYEALYESESSLIGHLSSLLKTLGAESHHDERLQPIIRQIEAGNSSLEEAAWGLRNYLDQLDVDPRELEQLQARLAGLERLERKYGPNLLAHLDTVCQELDNIGLQEDRRSSLLAGLGRLEAEYETAARELSQKRRKAAVDLALRVTSEVRTLAMPQAVFSINWQPLTEPRRTGVDVPVWHLAPNPGEESAPLAAIASGGELSRTMLALRSVLARKDLVQTLVFDEIDAGIGGEAAEGVGRKLKELANAYQVLCVTHLPQIARFADRHARIEKTVRGGRTRTDLRVLEPEERVEELARMMSGTGVTKAARQHVRELLDRG